LLDGRAGADVLIGGAGVDKLLGGTGQDLLHGGALVDDSDDALWEIAAAWRANQTNGATMLSDNADDDGETDLVNGESDNDWYLMFLYDVVNSQTEKFPNGNRKTS
jgi:Ca2+-binding RTX toxin-like protein